MTLFARASLFLKMVWRLEKVDENKNLQYYMDESATPYEDGENPYMRTKEDDEFDEKMIEKYHLKDR